MSHHVYIQVHLEYEAFPETLELLDRAISEVEKPDVLLFNTILRKACYRVGINFFNINMIFYCDTCASKFYTRPTYELTKT